MSSITVTTTINAPVAKVWEYFTSPIHITKWCFASEDWEPPHAENDLRVGGRFVTTMSAKDKSTSFDFGGTYTDVKEGSYFAYTMNGDDARKVEVWFKEVDGKTEIIETFDMENENGEEKQRGGWQSILDNFKKYTEGN